MVQMRWVETRHGWASGRYRIELAAERLWVLSRRTRKPAGNLVEPGVILGTAASRRALERSATALERRRNRWFRVLRHLAVTFGVGVVAVAAAAAQPALATLGIVVVVGVATRTLAVVAHALTGGAWRSISETYQ
jgi:hypothetical protein